VETEMPGTRKGKQRLSDELFDVVAYFIDTVSAQPTSLARAPAQLDVVADYVPVVNMSE
jgi:hypothetical protein